MGPSDNMVAVVGVVLIFGMPILYAIVSRVLGHQERIEMLRRGIVPPPDSKWARKAAKMGWYDPSTYGMPGAAPGPMSGAAPGYDPYAAMCYGANRALRKGITTAMIGFALLVGLSFIDLGRPGPWLLGGLIPLFVGVAQVIIALLSGAQMGPFGLGPRWQQPGMPPPSQQAQAPGQRPFTNERDVTPGGYGAWRPGAATGLEKPPSPPDVR
ncbi:MAG TPA: hypothetical protein VKT72_08690 [Candidatus Baltobacteraceae bacterium]|nr:hypothetical protein [Candidatus Baltobacteraceae bacterium]